MRSSNCGTRSSLVDACFSWVHELHLLGFQLLRICPYIYATGHWRCAIAPVSNTLKSHGARMARWTEEGAAHYTSASGDQYFGWTDGSGKGPKQLAKIFSPVSRGWLLRATARTGSTPGGWCGCWPIRTPTSFPTPLAIGIPLKTDYSRPARPSYRYRRRARRTRRSSQRRETTRSANRIWC